jgi:enterobactin synthetase component D
MISLTDNPLPLPAACFQVSCWFDQAACAETQCQQFGIALPARLAGAIGKRKAEFLAGRYCVQQALKKMGEDGGQVIDIGDKRAPLWPSGLTGSITHSKGFASAAVAPTQTVRGIGIDSERLIAEKTATSVASHILTETESYAANCTFVDSARQYLTLIFSAKESIFKCLYPEVKQYFDFHHAEISLNCHEPGTFQFQLRKHLSDEFHEHYVGNGHYAIVEDFVHTGIVLPPE